MAETETTIVIISVCANILVIRGVSFNGEYF